MHRTLFYRVDVLGEVIEDFFFDFGLIDVVMDVAARELEVLVGDGFDVDHSFIA